MCLRRYNKELFKIRVAVVPTPSPRKYKYTVEIRNVPDYIFIKWFLIWSKARRSSEDNGK